MKLLNIKTYTCNYTKKKVPVIPAGTFIQLAVDSKVITGMVTGIVKSKPKTLNNKYEYTYIIQKFGR